MRRILPISLGVLAAGLAVVPSAAADVFAAQPASRVCLEREGFLRVAVAYRAGPRWFRVSILDPAGAVVFARSGRARYTPSSWRYTPTQTGVFRTVYESSGGTRAFRTLMAERCAYVVRDDNFIAGFPVKRDGTLEGAMSALGAPARLRRDPRFRETCDGSWPDVGARIAFYNLGGANPCSPQAGNFSDAVLTASVWTTSRGLRVGAPLRRLRTLYRRAERHGSDWWLVVRRTVVSGRYPGLSARVRDGRVAAFRVIYPAGGD